MESIINVSYIINGIMAFIGVLYFGIIIYQRMKKKRKILFTKENVLQYFLGFFVLAPVLAVLYFIPIAFYDPNFWSVEASQYLEARNGVISLGVGILCFYGIVRAAIFMPHENDYYNIIPKLLFLSLFPGLASGINVMIISKYISGNFEAKYMLFFFAVATFIYIVTIRISKRKTVGLGVLIAHKFNMLVAKKMFQIPYRKYEQIEEGKIHTILNRDIFSVSIVSQNVVHSYISLITILMIQIYLFSINWVSSLMLFGVIFLILGIFTLMFSKINKVGLIARKKRDRYTNLIAGLINGFKELVLHKVKKENFKDDMEEASSSSYNAQKEYMFLGIDTGLVSELSFTMAVGISCLVFPLVFDLDKELVAGYVLGVLFLLGPVTVLINGVPEIMEAKISWKRIKDFINNAESKREEVEKIEETKISSIQKIEVKDVYFNYEDQEEVVNYQIGPINFEANEGELIFVIGGNGSGKTTFLKLLIGLYEPSSGSIFVNDEQISRKMLAECFSVIYSDFYLFKKLYDLKEDRLNQVNAWLEVLQLSDKVTIEDGVFSTIDLSKGQRKRLSILKSYLEDRPVYFFDEVAADLDPEFRDFFYNKLLIKLREEGKILIIISHDDKYFSLADSIYKMDMGQLTYQTKETLVLFE